MYKVLFLPLLQIPTGHHHVADSIREQLLESGKNFHCEKVDIISHCYGKWESFVSSFYLHWIHLSPATYSRIYQWNAVKGISKRYYIYERLFLKKVLHLLAAYEPNMVVCTHALPSYLINQIKKNHQWQGIALNVYTDYFINDLWGMDCIDYHFVPSDELKRQLLKTGIDPKRIFVTGIPVHPKFQQQYFKESHNSRITMLISGGNMGAGSIMKLIERLEPSGKIFYKVLCGKNHQLFSSIKKLKNPYVQPLPYISSKDEMNRLYEEADAIITKPGGVTISECLWKKLPIFVYEALPGQEEFNFRFLQKHGLVYDLCYENPKMHLESYMLRILNNETKEIRNRFESFYRGLEKRNILMLFEDILEGS